MFFPSPERPQIAKSILWNSASDGVFPFQNNPKTLSALTKTERDFLDCFGREEHPSYKEKKYGIAIRDNSEMINQGIVAPKIVILGLNHLFYGRKILFLAVKCYL